MGLVLFIQTYPACTTWSGRASPVACVCARVSAQSCPTLYDPMNCTCQDPLSMGFSRQDYWSGLPSPSPGDLPHPGIKPTSLASPALAGRFFTTAPPGKPGESPSLSLTGCILTGLPACPFPGTALFFQTHKPPGVQAWHPSSFVFLCIPAELESWLCP